jgi:DNA-binding beta-propeller fold protein YncE
MIRNSWLLLALAGSVGLVSCSGRGGTPEPSADAPDAPRLPTGVRLDPAGVQWQAGSLPLAIVPSPDSTALVLLLSGWREQGVQVLDRRSGAIRQTLEQPAAFLGLAFSPDGSTLFASGGNEDLVYRYSWRDGRATLRDSLILARKAEKGAAGTRYPAQLAPSPDGRWLYVVENLGDSLAVFDLGTGTLVQRLPAGRYPYGIVVTPDGTVFVSSWAERDLYLFTPNASGAPLRADGRIPVGRHPSAMALTRDGSRLAVVSATTDRTTVIDTRARRVIATIEDQTPAALGQGSSPNAVTFDADETSLWIAEGDNNAVARLALSSATAGRTSPFGRDTLLGRAPVGWYPAALRVLGDTLFVVNAKGGKRPGPNRVFPNPGQVAPDGTARAYTLGQLDGSLLALPLTEWRDSAALSRGSARVAAANGWTTRTRASGYPPLRHVLYIIKENRTYDQVLGDLPIGDGDSSLTYFPRAVSPNHHALAERFGVFDRFFVNAEVSADGHNWSMAAFTTDYHQKTVPSNYSGRGRQYDYEGTNRGVIPSQRGQEDVSEPSNGYLWDLAARKGISFRNYGEYVVPEDEDDREELPKEYLGSKPFLEKNTNTAFPGYDLRIPDQRRADVWLADLAEFSRRGEMPRLQIIRLPNDHTSGARVGRPTPRAYMADNDLALGRVVEGLSRSPFWQSSVVFVVEDDAQNGPDHVDSHRAPFFVVSPWVRDGVHHRFTNTTDALATMEEILGLDALSPFDYYGRPLRDIWRATPDLRPYTALRSSVPLDERNTPTSPGARESAALSLGIEDVADEDVFNRILWRVHLGDRRPYPGARRMSAAEWWRSR